MRAGTRAWLIDPCGGQTALVDSILFMILMLLASGIILGTAGTGTRADEGLHQYTEDFSGTLLAVEMPGAPDGGGARPVSQILCDQAILYGQSNFTAMNDAVLDTGNSLIRPGLAYAISFGNQFISSNAASLEKLPAQRQACQHVYLIQGSEIVITVYVWEAGA